MIIENNTITAIATPPGIGGIAIIRISGSQALQILKDIFIPKHKTKLYKSHMLYYGHIHKDYEIIDEVMAVYMKKPRTYTREDVVEVHCHGGSIVADQILSLILSKGANIAEAGEFTKRAFLNGRIDLSQAEAVMDIISASGKKAARAALHQLSGGTSKFILDAQNSLYDLAAALEVAIDYPEEVEEKEAVSNLEQGLRKLAKQLEQSFDIRSAKLLSEGMTVAICGRPNVGKSSLLNALTKQEHAIVTDVPGTTRDIISATLEIDGVFVRLYDTAGIRESQDKIESMGIKRAKSIMDKADLLMFVIDASQPLSSEDEKLLFEYKSKEVELILNKDDLDSTIEEKELLTIVPDINIHRVSSLTGQGLENILNLLKQKAMLPSENFLTNQRHIQAAIKAAEHLLSGAKALSDGIPLDLVGIDIRLANEALGEITGTDISERVLDRIFENFCVGK